VKVSLVVPLRDEAASVTALLESIDRQHRLPDELVVVDAGSQDETAALVLAFPARFPVTLAKASPSFPGVARNAGVHAATHPWLAFTDGGVQAAPGWLGELLTVAHDQAADVVFGSYDPVCDTFFRKSAALAYVPAPRVEGVRGPFVASMMLKRGVFDDAGGFPPFRAAEDLIFLERVMALPIRIGYAPRAVVRWELAPDARRTFRRFALYSEHNLRAGRGKHWHAGVLRHYALMAFTAATGALTGAGAWSLLVYPFWQIARAARSAWQKRRAFDFRTLDPRYILGAAALLSLIDLATLTGAVRWVRHGRPRTP
jgi:glycosyltransferase involved in cell wall biosynthesis